MFFKSFVLNFVNDEYFTYDKYECNDEELDILNYESESEELNQEQY